MRLWEFEPATETGKEETFFLYKGSRKAFWEDAKPKCFPKTIWEEAVQRQPMFFHFTLLSVPPSSLVSSMSGTISTDRQALLITYLVNISKLQNLFLPCVPTCVEGT